MLELQDPSSATQGRQGRSEEISVENEVKCIYVSDQIDHQAEIRISFCRRERLSWYNVGHEMQSGTLRVRRRL